ncbi:hypothetical protein FRC04_006942 [Tulasnella sp. 424]|nr:hypothetical protein FRC04_006942 [Tulasnella sp. 424]
MAAASLVHYAISLTATQGASYPPKRHLRLDGRSSGASLGFVEDDKSWRSYIEEMRLNDQARQRHQWSTGPDAPGDASASSAIAQYQDQVQVQRDMSAGAAPGPDEDLPAAYVAYHDWKHYSSIRNLTGIPNVVENHHRTQCATRETVIIIVVPALDDDPPINSLKSFNGQEHHPRRQLTQLRSYYQHDHPQFAKQQCTFVVDTSRRQIRFGYRSVARSREKSNERSKGTAKDVMKRQIDLRRQRGDVPEREEEDGEGDDDERAEKEVSVTLLPPGLTASQSTEDDDEEEDDDEDYDEVDGAGAPNSTSASPPAPPRSLYHPSLNDINPSKKAPFIVHRNAFPDDQKVASQAQAGDLVGWRAEQQQQQ